MNTRFRALVKRSPYRTFKALARDAGVSLTTMQNILTGRVGPIDNDGSIRDFVHRLAECLNCLPEQMFAPECFEQPAEAETVDEVTPEVVASVQQARDTVASLFRYLTPREERIIRMRFVQECTLEDVATAFGVTRERVRTIEAKALHKMRNPRIAIKCRDNPYVSNVGIQSGMRRYLTDGGLSWRGVMG